MAHFSPFMQANFSAQNQRGASGSRLNAEQDFDDDDEDDDSLSSQSNSRDKIRRNYIAAPTNNNNNLAANDPASPSSQSHQRNHYQIPETIQVKLNESYFANERRAAVNLLANCRQKLNSLQMFNPAKNQSIREQQEKNWEENVSKNWVDLSYKFGGKI